MRSRFDSESPERPQRHQVDSSQHSDNDSNDDHAKSPRDHRHSDERHRGYNDYLDETPPRSPVELLPDLPPYYPAIQGCRNVEEFKCLCRIEEGTYGVVYKATDKKTGECLNVLII